MPGYGNARWSCLQQDPACPGGSEERIPPAGPYPCSASSIYMHTLQISHRWQFSSSYGATDLQIVRREHRAYGVDVVHPRRQRLEYVQQGPKVPGRTQGSQADSHRATSRFTTACHTSSRKSLLSDLDKAGIPNRMSFSPEGAAITRCT